MSRTLYLRCSQGHPNRQFEAVQLLGLDSLGRSRYGFEFFCAVCAEHRVIEMTAAELEEKNMAGDDGVVYAESPTTPAPRMATSNSTIATNSSSQKSWKPTKEDRRFLKRLYIARE
jgi:hypothetical protein